MGQFRIEKLVGPVACRLGLGTRLKGVHGVFHISLLQLYHTGGNSVVPPEPIVVDGTAEFKVERILVHRDRRGHARENLVHWDGHDSSENLWLMESDLKNAPDVLRCYKSTIATKKGRLGLPPCV